MALRTKDGPFSLASAPPMVTHRAASPHSINKGAQPCSHGARWIPFDSAAGSLASDAVALQVVHSRDRSLIRKHLMHNRFESRAGWARSVHSKAIHPEQGR